MKELLGLGLSPAMLAAIGVLVALQLVLQVAALVSLARTPSSRIAFGGRKWIWVLIIVLGEILGLTVYFAVGRVPALTQERPGARPVSGLARIAADALYGPAPSAGTAHDETPVTTEDPEIGADGTGMGELP